VDMVSSSASGGASGLNGPRQIGVFDFGNRRLLVVADKYNNRVLLWDVSMGIASLTLGQAADFVLGQPNMSSTASGVSSVSLNHPVGVTRYRNRLLVSDNWNHRVLAFDLGVNGAQLANGMAATLVLGQSDFISALANRGGTAAANTINDPGMLDLYGNYLFVPEWSNARVTVYDLSSLTNGMNASYLFGQSSFTSTTAATSQTGMDGPWSVAASGSFLFVADDSNNSVISYDISNLATAISSATYGVAATNMLGQTTHRPGMADGSEAVVWGANGSNDTGATGVQNPEDAVAGRVAGVDYLFVADSWNDRVLAFVSDSYGVPLDMQADFVLGQPDFDHDTVGLTASGMNTPQGVAFDDVTTTLFVADSGNNRVLVFNLASGISSGMAATAVLGQASFTSSASGLSQTAFNTPLKMVVGSVGGVRYLFVVDRINDRIMLFNISNGIVTNEPAAFVLGGPDFVTNLSGAAANQLLNPRGIDFDPASSRLFVADGSADRVMIWDLSQGVVNGMSAFAVLGHTSFTSTVSGLSDAQFFLVNDVAFDVSRNLLWVADNNNSRLLGFDLSAGVSSGMSASMVIGQPDFITNTRYNRPSSRSAFTLDDPAGLYVAGDGLLFILSRNDDRLVVFAPRGVSSH
ncbi:MAG: NHL repeat-containing protein, partial [Mariprofundales bacterium]|nr:NHL repeat-containing protein [Mariprofundales bacterium]